MRAGYVWDDRNYVPDDPYSRYGRCIRGEDGLYRIWIAAEATDYWPLTHTTFWLEWRLWGDNPSGYHVVNILLHAIAALLLWRLLNRLQVPGAYLAGLIFAVHPVCAASVAWISERKNTLSMVFYLLAILIYLRHERFASWRWYIVSLVAFALALLSKTSVVMLPVVLLGLAWWQRGRIAKKDLARSIPFFILAGVMSAVTIYFQHQRAIGHWMVPREEGFLSRLAATGWVVWFYLYKALLPVKLSMIYPRWSVDAGSVLSYLPLLALAGGLVVLWRLRRTSLRGLLAALGYFAVTLFPVLGFFGMAFGQYSRVADHFQYVPLLGIIALTAGVLGRTCQAKRRQTRRAALAIAAGLVAVLAVLTWRQARVYKNQETLWNDVLAKNDKAWVAHSALGSLHAAKGEIGKAVERFHAAIRIEPADARTHNNMGLLYDAVGQLDKAAQQYQTAIRIWPKHPSPYFNLGNLYARTGQIKQAETHYRKALQIAPDYADVHNNLAGVIAREGRLDEAIEHYRHAIQLKPADPDPRNNMGIMLERQSKFEEAIQSFRAALAASPLNVMAMGRLAWLLATAPQEHLRDGSRAVALAEKACRTLTRQTPPTMLDTLAAAYAEAGRFGEARNAAQHALELLGDDRGDQAREIEKRLALYKASKPYHQPPPAEQPKER